MAEGELGAAPVSTNPNSLYGHIRVTVLKYLIELDHIHCGSAFHAEIRFN
jgi:hypothetical protein